MPKKDKSPIDIEKALELIDTAKGAVLRNLLEKIRDGKELAAHEIKLLNEFETKFQADQSMAGRRIVKSQKDVAEYLGKSERSIAYYKSQYDLPVNPDGTYDLDAIDTWVESRKENGIGQPHGKPESGDKSGWEAIYKEMKARLAELEFNQKKGELISLADVKSQWTTRIIEVKNALLALPRKLPPLLEGKEKRDMEAIMEQELRFILERFSREGGKLKK